MERRNDLVVKLEFQSLIGRLQTSSQQEANKFVRKLFQSLIGRLQTEVEMPLCDGSEESFNPS